MSKMKYTITTYSCPHCHKIIKRENTAFAFLLIIVIYWVIAHAIMKLLYKDYYIVKVGESTESCPHCNNPISTGKIEYNRLNEDDKKNYDFRWYYRFSVFLGGFIIQFILFQFLRIDGTTFSNELANIFLIISTILLGIIIGIWIYWRSLNKKSITSHNEHHLEKTSKSNQTKKE